MTEDERTGLLHENEHDQVIPQHADSDSSAAEGIPAPLPWRPLLVVFLLNAMQPLAFEVVFPFVNQMILEIGIVTDPERVGFYSGVIESIYSCMSFLAILPCSILADSIGRKPVILWGTTGLAISVVCFGMSKSFPAMVLSRCLGGALGGVWACTRIVVAELTDRSNQGLAFSAHTVFYRLGQIFGLSLGGLLAHPERNFSWFRTPFWYEYPFVLACFVSAALCLGGVVSGYFLLHETLRSKRKDKIPTTYGINGSPNDMDSSSPSATRTSNMKSDPSEGTIKMKYKSIMTPSIISLLCSNIGMCLASEVLFAVFPLFSFTPVSSGGLGMTEAGIGAQMGARAVLCIAAVGFYTPLERRLGAVRVYQLSIWTLPIVALFFPLLNLLARRGATNEWPFMICFSIFMVLWSIGNLGWTAIAVITNDFAPSAAALATLNGMSQMAIILSQAIAPAFVTSLFAASIKSDIAGGNLVWIILCILSSAAALHSLTLRKPDTDWRLE